MRLQKKRKDKNLANCRSGEYEGLSKKLIDGKDFGTELGIPIYHYEN